MPTKAYFEWDVETYVEYDDADDEDIIDHHHSEIVAPLLPMLEGPDCPTLTEHGPGVLKARLVLVRDEYDTEIEELIDRSWAYVESGELPETFDNGKRIPLAYHRELATAIARHAK